ncbi:MAG: hypothetical protein DYG91_03795 [Chloroflexi bacterium CFX7]|nr:hypothetical protein [Chloroflexi bacterium CFX7]
MRVPSAFPVVVFLLCSLNVAACSSRQPSTAEGQPGASLTQQAITPAVARDGTEAAPEGGTASLPKEGCEVRASPGPGGPVTDPQGPYYHRVAVARIANGERLSDAKVVLDHASVPDGVETAGGRVLIYYVNGADHGVFVAELDGDAATPLGPITLDGVPKPQGVVDPDATLLSDGRIRLAYMSGMGGPGGAGGWSMCLADSTDGVNFTVIGQALRFTSTVSTDPSLAELRGGGWLMAVSQGANTVLARAEDGLQFEVFATVDYGGVPEVTILADGRVALYVCSMKGIGVHASADQGKTWRQVTTISSPIAGSKLFCDPSVVTGTDLFVFKVGPGKE